MFVQIWLVGEGVRDEEQMKAPKGTTFIPFYQFPPKIVRKDCFYHFTPAMKAPSSLENMHSCEVITKQIYIHTVRVNFLTFMETMLNLFL